ncbi:unannotated protein [freshwater metagenome]|uniref:Unannotated protein n=1 Tax=freshwater metagenome TaxID=449393 RepID=A0A6J6SF27_9ZZZZ|nr:DUF448 domain-containing protein [Actinomycetota bacterium]
MPIPIRSCIACRKRENFSELLRVVQVGNQVLPDQDHRKFGRGAWLHRNCFDVAKQRRSFQRAFRCDEDLSTDSLENYLNT